MGAGWHLAFVLYLLCGLATLHYLNTFLSQPPNTLDCKVKAEFNGLANKLSSANALLNIALMYDALEELSELSQAEAMNINKAHRLIARQLEVFTSRTSNSGVWYISACQAVDDGTFRGVPINHVNPKVDKIINRCQFYQGLIDSLSSRLMPESEHGLPECTFLKSVAF